MLFYHLHEYNFIQDNSVLYGFKISDIDNVIKSWRYSILKPDVHICVSLSIEKQKNILGQSSLDSIC